MASAAIVPYRDDGFYLSHTYTGGRWVPNGSVSAKDRQYFETGDEIPRAQRPKAATAGKAKAKAKSPPKSPPKSSKSSKSSTRAKKRKPGEEQMDVDEWLREYERKRVPGATHALKKIAAYWKKKNALARRGSTALARKKKKSTALATRKRSAALATRKKKTNNHRVGCGCMFCLRAAPKAQRARPSASASWVVDFGRVHETLHKRKKVKKARKAPSARVPAAALTVKELRAMARQEATRKPRLVRSHASASSACKTCGHIHTQRAHRGHKFGGKLMPARRRQALLGR